MTAFWIAAALLAAGFGGWPVTALVFRLARTIDDKADAAAKGRDTEDDPSADVTVDVPGRATDDDAGQAVNGELTVATGQPASGVPAEPVQRILRGGAIIGVLERLGVCLAILAGQPVAIAYIVAVKGLGRFAELKETPVAAERFIIGTLASMLWAAGIAAAVKVIFLA
ncbi:hypothetical protein HWD94_08575 [Pseudarthrobacter equi]|uniref:hypothetical protein n=1 Tax=Pseudarthrobacter equi TaxID=728066 RepID=UPI0021BEDBF6|nr:hypothetical protein [Pseudarthrobacter equi]MCT9625172.1 hypothetical protein [Pseudarthrobacter equi]